MTIERQELHCHACDQYVQFNLDMELNGQHVLECPNCGHEHCRVVKDGKITGERWDQRNGGQTYQVSTSSVTYSTSSTYTTMGSSSYYTYQAWTNTTTWT